MTDQRLQQSARRARAGFVVADGSGKPVANVPSETISVKPDFPWYDSPWLESFVRAKAYLAEQHPDRLADFVRAFDVLRTDPGFEVKRVAGMLSAEEHERLRQLVIVESRQARDKHEMLRFGRLIVHNAPICTELQAKLTDAVSALVGEPVEPCYNFLSLYNDLGVCAVHMDAPSAKWTFDYCIEQSAPWPIWLSQVRPWPEEGVMPGEGWDAAIRADPANRFTPFTLQEGEAILFGGSSQWHYRDRIARTAASNFCNLVFFHYVPAGTQSLTDPQRWAERFDVPALAEVITPSKGVDRTRIG